MKGRPTEKYASAPSSVLTFFSVSGRALRSTSRDRKAARIKNTFTSSGRRAQLDAKRLCTRIKKFFSRNSRESNLSPPRQYRRARYRDTRSHETRGDVVEIECEPREELREAERQTHAYACTQRASERANFRGRKRASEAAFYEGGWVRNRAGYGGIYLALRS